MKLPAINQTSLLTLISNLHTHHKTTSEKQPNLHYSEFLSSIVHELKTPLSAIQTYAEELQTSLNNNSKEECLEYIKEIKQISSDMGELVHDILDTTQNSLGKFSVDLSKEIDVLDAIKRATRINHDYALRRNIALEVSADSNLVFAHLDIKRMKQIMTNLISNAIKYSPKKTTIKVIAKRHGDSLEISVIDQGFGMTKSQIATAFEKYQTIQNPNSGKVDSFGLGLPITKQLVELQNGKIEVISQVGKGTEIKLKFPL